MIIIGIDPGKSGGISWATESGVPLAQKIPATATDIVDLLEQIDSETEHQHDSEIKCYIEKVASTPQQGVVSAFTFGRGFGTLEGILSALKIPYEFISPQKWQKELQCMTGGDKNVSKAKAQQLWPSQKWTHATADSALICEYGRRQQKGTK